MVYKLLLYLLDEIIDLNVSEKISFAPENIQPGIAYHPKDVSSLSLAAKGICNEMFNLRFNFSIFENLKQLDLSLNNLSDLTLLNLQHCVSLVALDLHRNNISNTFSEVVLNPSFKCIISFCY